MAKGMCNSHYMYLYKHGSIVGYEKRKKWSMPHSITEYSTYILGNCDIDDESGCWNWTGAITDYGYGRAAKYSNNRSWSLAHRISYDVFIGGLDSKLTIDHLCFNRKCVNPFHLEQVTLAVNAYRASSTRNVNKGIDI